MVPADPWPRSRVTPAPFPLGCPFAGRGGAESAPQRRRFIFLGGCLGAHFRVPVSPAGEVLSSPEMPVQDNETKAGIFPVKVIIVDSGKLYVIKSVFSIDCGGLGTTFLSHLFFHVKRFWIWPSFSG